MSPDRPVPYRLTPKARAELDVAVVQVGDVVRVGRGQRLWRVDGFLRQHHPGDEPIASLLPLVGYTRGSALVSRLTVVERTGGAP
jgi:hypothetical protein